MNIETYYPSAEALNLRIDMKATGKNLAAIFAERGQSLSSTSNLIAVSPQAVHHWTIGKKSPEARELNLPSRDTEV